MQVHGLGNFVELKVELHLVMWLAAAWRSTGSQAVAKEEIIMQGKGTMCDRRWDKHRLEAGAHKGPARMMAAPCNSRLVRAATLRWWSHRTTQ